ncbi:MAG: hypothetical protein ACI8RE_000092 [Ilumatobacter sp.]|jgi:hypothetical protein
MTQDQSPTLWLFRLPGLLGSRGLLPPVGNYTRPREGSRIFATVQRDRPASILQLQNFPGTVDTGSAQGEQHEDVTSMFPDGRWSIGNDVATFVWFLASDEGARIRCQALNSEDKFNPFY